jgi:hypothetical protein
MRPLDDQLGLLAAATAQADVLTGVDKSFIANAIFNATEIGPSFGFRIVRPNVLVPDMTAVRVTLSSPAAFATLWVDVIDKQVHSTVEIAATKIPWLASAGVPVDGAVYPCIALSVFAGEALTRVIQAAKARWPSAKVAWLVVFLLSEIYFAGRLHLRLHDGLVSQASEFPTLAALSGQSSLANNPNYYAYDVDSDPVLAEALGRPASQPASQLALTAPAAPPARSHSRSQPASAAQAPTGRSVPWVLQHPDEPRVDNMCPFCGPGHRHALGKCRPNAAYVTKPGAVRLPSFKEFPVGMTYTAYLAGAGAKNSSRPA